MGEPFNNRWKLPIPPPEQCVLKLGARQGYPKKASGFFQLPVEVRELIYIELMGDQSSLIYSDIASATFSGYT